MYVKVMMAALGLLFTLGAQSETEEQQMTPVSKWWSELTQAHYSNGKIDVFIYQDAGGYKILASGDDESLYYDMDEVKLDTSHANYDLLVVKRTDRVAAEISKDRSTLLLRNRDGDAQVEGSANIRLKRYQDSWWRDISTAMYESQDGKYKISFSSGTEKDIFHLTASRRVGNGSDGTAEPIYESEEVFLNQEEPGWDYFEEVKNHGPRRKRAAISKNHQTMFIYENGKQGRLLTKSRSKLTEETIRESNEAQPE